MEKLISKGAQAHQKLNNLDAAIDDYDHAILMDAKNYKAYYNAGGVNFLKKDYEKAIKLFTKAIGIKPDFGDAYNDRGSSYRMLRKFDLALADYKKAGKYMPKHAFVFNNLGAVKKMLKDFEGAKAAYGKALALDSDFYLSL